MSIGFAHLIGQLCSANLCSMTSEDAQDHATDLADLAERYREASRQLDAARAELIAGLRAASEGGMRQADMVRAIDHEWTREYVRKVLAR